MTQMNSYEFLRRQINENLGGDEKRIPELFVDESVFDRLAVLGNDGDWYHYKKKTVDGWYLVKTANGYAAYYQERGSVSDFKAFEKLQDAASYFYRASGFVRP